MSSFPLTYGKNISVRIRSLGEESADDPRALRVEHENTANLLIPVICYDVNNCIYPNTDKHHLAFDLCYVQVHSHLSPCSFFCPPSCASLRAPRLSLLCVPSPVSFPCYCLVLSSGLRPRTVYDHRKGEPSYCSIPQASEDGSSELHIVWTPPSYPLGAHHGPSLSPVQVRGKIWRSFRRRPELSR